MPIRKIQKIPVLPIFNLSHPVEKVSEDGIVSVTYEPDTHPLPKAENFDLGNQLRAGVNIKEVNTKCLGNSAAVAAVVNKVSKTKQTNKES